VNRASREARELGASLVDAVEEESGTMTGECGILMVEGRRVRR
jgi:hypothetical protein